MLERIIKIREMANLTQEEFANQLQISRNFVNQVENGKKNFSERTINEICKKIKIGERSINKNWIITGKGEMLRDLTRNQEIQSFANNVMEEVDESFRKKFIHALSKLDERDWETISKIVDSLNKEG